MFFKELSERDGEGHIPIFEVDGLRLVIDASRDVVRLVLIGSHGVGVTANETHVAEVTKHLEGVEEAEDGWPPQLVESIASRDNTTKADKDFCS